MVWAAVFPTGPQLISQSVGQFQANWAFIETNVNVDHYFNAVVPANEGHHKFSQYVNQGVDPAVAVDSVLYSKNATLGLSTTPQPFFRNSTNVRQIATFLSGTTILAPGTTTLFDCTPLQPFMGWLQVVNLAPPTDYAVAFVYWNGLGTVIVRNLFVNGNVTAVVGVGALVRVTSAAGIGVSWSVYTIPL